MKYLLDLIQDKGNDDTCFKNGWSKK